jgi:outer membrane PBP1 activator LpoA protein
MINPTHDPAVHTSISISQSRLNRAFAVMLAVVLALLQGCGNPGNGRQLDSPLTQIVPTPQLAASLVSEGDTAQAAHVYAQLASDEVNPELALQYQLLATELYFDSDLYREAMRAYELLPEELFEPSLRERKTLIDAYAQLAQENPAQALAEVPQPRSIGDRILRIRALEIQARAHELLADPVQALKARILIEANLTRPVTIANNREATRRMLANVDTPSLQQMAAVTGGTVYRGWVEYMLLQRTTGSASQDTISQRTQVWSNRYPGHPASLSDTNLQSGPDFSATTAISTDRIALLLPLSGKFGKVGNAIKNGFLGAHYGSAANGESRIQIFDTESNLNKALSQYDAAVASGASLIVGPLSKSAVIKLAATNRVTIPTLSLNYTSADTPPSANLYQFGLLPEDEARDAASYLIGENLKKALVVAADNTVGTRLADAFSETYTEKGGLVLGVEKIPQDSYDYSPQLKKLLAINQSNARARQLRNLLDTKLEFEPAIRGDVEAIFLALGAEQARLLRPQLQFHHANDLPLVSTSQIFSGTIDKRADGDLTGVIYNDMPWVIDNARKPSKLYADIQRVSGEPDHRMSRLNALGVDAWRLHGKLETMRFDRAFAVTGTTGALTLADGNRIRRRLDWVEFESGEPVKRRGPLPVNTVLPRLTTGL